MDRSMFDEKIETLNPEALHQQIELPAMRSMLAYVLQKSPFYQKKLSALSGDVDDLVHNWHALPFTEKDEVITDQLAEAPYGSNCCVPAREIVRVHKTSGTTNRPVIVGMTKRDIASTVAVGARAFYAAGLRNYHTVVHCLNYCMWMGGYTDHQSLETTGAAVVPFGVGNTAALLQTIKTLNITALHCTPSYLSILEKVAKDEFGWAPHELGITLGLFGGEMGMQYPEVRESIEKRWGMKAMNANYGMADVFSLFASECSQQNGLHFMGQGYVLAELIDPESAVDIPLHKGALGELVLTTLVREAQPVLRFRTRDLIRIIDTSPCQCGRTSFRFEVVGRRDDMVVVKGINIFPGQITAVLEKMLDVVNGHFRVVLDNPPPLQSLKIRVEIRATVLPERHLEVAAHISQRCKTEIGVAPNVEFVEEGALGRTEGKTNYIIRNF